MRDAFHGKGKVQIAFRGEEAILRIDAATTQTRRLKALLADFLRKEVAHMRPGYQPFEVRIWTSETGERNAHDVDNVAKAVLDALNGVFWRDDRQVVRLTSEKFTGERARIAVRVRPLSKVLDPVEMDVELFDA